MELIIKTGIKQLIKENVKLSITDEFYGRLEKKVEEVIKNACKRAIENGRHTVMGKDV